MSFVPAKSARAPLAGTRPSAFNAHVLTSTGNKDLDAAVGGGLALGTLTMVEEDSASSFSTHLLRSFVAQGVAFRHACVLIAVSPLDQFVCSLPSPFARDATPVPAETVNKPDLKIAWQYGKYAPQSASAGASGFCTSRDFDFGTPLPTEIREATLYPTSIPEMSDPYHCAYQVIRERLAEFVAEGGPRVVRIALFSLAGPLWSAPYHADHERRLLAFLHSLRGLLREHECRAVLMATVPSSLFAESLASRCRRLFDGVFTVQSFAGTRL
mmetsp:Transcript_70607/g.166484  ORF Transcript_70607/g.166484 Transcript_70607/m.166484 type:complete len:270 (-) Transcript_70607:8-817(-)